MTGRALKEYQAGEYTLLMDMNALADIELELGYGMGVLFQKAKENPTILQSPHILRVLFWGGLQEHHPCDLRQAGKFMSDFEIEDLASHLVSAIEKAHPRAKKKSKKKMKKNAKA